MKTIIKVAIDLGIAFVLISIKPLDAYSYFIGLITMLIWNTTDLIYEKWFK